MKWIALILGIFTLGLWGLAGLRLYTAAPDEPPVWEKISQPERPENPDALQRTDPPPINAPGARMRGMEEMSEIGSTRSKGGTESSTDAFEEAGEKLDNRESDLDEAKQKMKRLPGGGG